MFLSYLPPLITGKRQLYRIQLVWVTELQSLIHFYHPRPKTPQLRPHELESIGCGTLLRVLRSDEKQEGDAERLPGAAGRKNWDHFGGGLGLIVFRCTPKFVCTML